MARYFLEVRYGALTTLDEDGVELPSDAAAIAEAEETARDIIADGIRLGARSRSGVITIYDERDRTVALVDFGGSVSVRSGDSQDHIPDV
jgi:hypothetical protein